VSELQASFADRRVIGDRQEPRRVRHERAVEEGLVVIEQNGQVDGAVDVGGLVAEWQKNPLQLEVLGFGRVGDEAEGLPLGLCKCGGFIE
jgi:hypothetical protein